MQIERDKPYAVLTGDVVGSSRLSSSDRRAMQAAMLLTSRAISEELGDVVAAPPEIFRGDGWQILVEKPAAALRVALYFRADLRSRMESHQFDTRVAIAIGRVDFVPEAGILQGDGEAFRLSGGTLESMKKRGGMRLVAADRPAERGLDVVVQLIDALASKWSDKQARAITGALRGLKQAEIAESWSPKPISQQAVAQHLDRSSWASIEVGLAYFEGVVATLNDGEQAK